MKNEFHRGASCYEDRYNMLTLIGEWPWIAKLGYRTPTSSGMFLLQTIVNCNGILIANKWIITTVSCDTVTYISKNKS